MPQETAGRASSSEPRELWREVMKGGRITAEGRNCLGAGEQIRKLRPLS